MIGDSNYYFSITLTIGTTSNVDNSNRKYGEIKALYTLFSLLDYVESKYKKESLMQEI